MAPSIMEKTGLSREDAYLIFVHNVQGNLAVNRLLGWRRGPEFAHAQELLGADDAQMQGLLQTLGRGTLTVTEIGAETALGVCKWHEKADETAGYMNLMLN